MGAETKPYWLLILDQVVFARLQLREDKRSLPTLLLFKLMYFQTPMNSVGF